MTTRIRFSYGIPQQVARRGVVHFVVGVLEHRTGTATEAAALTAAQSRLAEVAAPLLHRPVMPLMGEGPDQRWMGRVQCGNDSSSL
jgi:hypothetical protein